MDIAFLELEKGTKAVILKTNEDRKLLLFYLIFRGCIFLFECLVNYFTVLNWRGVGLYVRLEVSRPIFKMGRSKQNDIVEL